MDRVSLGLIVMSLYCQNKTGFCKSLHLIAILQLITMQTLLGYSFASTSVISSRFGDSSSGCLPLVNDVLQRTSANC